MFISSALQLCPRRLFLLGDLRARSFLRLHSVSRDSGETSRHLLPLLWLFPCVPASSSPLPLPTSLCVSARKSKSQHDCLPGSNFGPNVSSLRSTAASFLHLFFLKKKKKKKEMGLNENRRSLCFRSAELLKEYHLMLTG